MIDVHDIEALREEGDLAVMRAALRLEEEAVTRYAEQAAATSDPRLFTYWEALRRNETEHREELAVRIAALSPKKASR